MPRRDEVEVGAMFVPADAGRITRKVTRIAVAQRRRTRTPGRGPGAAAPRRRGRRTPAEPDRRRPARPRVHADHAAAHLPRSGEPGPAALRCYRRFRLSPHRATSAVLSVAYPFLA